METHPSFHVKFIPHVSREEVEKWFSLLGEDAAPTFFQTPLWVLTWMKCVEESGRSMGAWGVFDTQDNPVGFFLGTVFTKKIGPFSLLKRFYLFETGCPSLDVLTCEYMQPIGPVSTQDTVGHLLGAWLETTSPLPFDEIVASRMTQSHGRFYGGKRFAPHVFREDTGVVIPLQEAKAQGDILSLVSSNTRYQIRRSLKKYAERGPLTMVATDSPTVALTWFDEMLGLHGQHWENKGHRGAQDYPLMETFHKTLLTTPHALNHQVEMVKISAGEDTLGYLYNFLHRGRVFYYLSGFRYEEDPHLRPGMVCHVLCARGHMEKGDSLYDFMGGPYRYKNSLGIPQDAMIGLSLEKRSVKNHLLTGIKAIKNLRFSKD